MNVREQYVRDLSMAWAKRTDAMLQRTRDELLTMGFTPVRASVLAALTVQRVLQAEAERNFRAIGP